LTRGAPVTCVAPSQQPTPAAHPRYAGAQTGLFTMSTPVPWASSGNRSPRIQITRQSRTLSSSAARLKRRWTRERFASRAPAVAIDPRHRPATGNDVTVIGPAYNEAPSIADTIRRLQPQTAPDYYGKPLISSGCFSM